MDLEILKAALSGASALSAIVSGYKSALEIGKHYSVSDAESAERIASQAVESIPPSELGRLYIQQDALDPLLKNIYEVKENLKRSIADRERSKAQVLQDMDEADSAICFWLKSIKRYHQDKLPTVAEPNLYDLWLQHRCH